MHIADFHTRDFGCALTAVPCSSAAWDCLVLQNEHHSASATALSSVRCWQVEAHRARVEDLLVLAKAASRKADEAGATCAVSYKLATQAPFVICKLLYTHSFDNFPS